MSKEIQSGRISQIRLTRYKYDNYLAQTFGGREVLVSMHLLPSSLLKLRMRTHVKTSIKIPISKL